MVCVLREGFVLHVLRARRRFSKKLNGPCNFGFLLVLVHLTIFILAFLLAKTNFETWLPPNISLRQRQ